MAKKQEPISKLIDKMTWYNDVNKTKEILRRLSEAGEKVEDRLVEITGVNGTLNIEYSAGETWLVGTVGDFSITESGLPSTGRTKTITIHFPPGVGKPTWTTRMNQNKTGEYVEGEWNTVVVEHINNILVKMQITQNG